jgi:hypothetical protein
MDSFRPLTPYPPAAIGTLRTLSLRIAGLEQQASEARTQNAKHANLAAHPATRRFLDELEFLHASHARALRMHATALTDECALATAPGSRNPFDQSAPAAPTSDPEEILISTYSQLNELAAHYTRLQTLALAFEHRSTANLSLNHLKEITPKIMECSQAIPLLTADLAVRRFGHVSPGCGETALETTQAAWKNETQFPATT